MKKFKGLFLLIVIFILPGCSKPKDYYSGYIDGKIRFISANFSGLLTKLYVDEGSFITKGQRLFSLESFPEAYEVDIATANFKEVEEKINQLMIEKDFIADKLKRRKSLNMNNYISQEEIKQLNHDLNITITQLGEAQENLASLKFHLQETEWTLSKKSVFAEVDGFVHDVFYRPSELIIAGRPVLALVIPEDLRITFFVPEKDLAKLSLGQKVYINYDGAKNLLQAHISYISSTPEFTAPIIFSEQTRTKMVFLLEARVDNKKDNQDLHSGQPVSVYPFKEGNNEDLRTSRS